MNCYLGIDIGSISTKGVIIDDNNKIISSVYINTDGSPIEATRNLLDKLKIPANYILKGIGTTGSARKIIGIMLDANVVKNEITAHAIGTLNLYPNIRTILEIGGQDSKIILINNGIITDYAMNTLCAAGTGSFLTSQSKRLGVDVESFGDIAFKSDSPVKIAARCTVFAESDLVHKAQIGYKKNDIIAGLCRSVVLNYVNNVCKGKKIEEPIIFQGGVSKNKGVHKYFEEILGKKVIVDDNGHLMGAYGVAILAKKNKTDKVYEKDLKNIKFITKGSECSGCSNNCELVKIFKDDKLVDTWGSKCKKY